MIVNVLFFFDKSVMYLKTISAVLSSKLPVGSSANNTEGFFIMAEGSQVDWAGHVNNLDYLITEMKDLDTAIEWALEYAKDNDDTLVVVTSDHETGGLLIEPANPVDYTSQGIKISFNTAVGSGTHTGVPVPIYAYGPGAENFTGTLDNTDVYGAITASLDLDEQNGSCLTE